MTRQFLKRAKSSVEKRHWSLFVRDMVVYSSEVWKFSICPGLEKTSIGQGSVAEVYLSEYQESIHARYCYLSIRARYDRLFVPRHPFQSLHRDATFVPNSS